MTPVCFACRIRHIRFQGLGLFIRAIRSAREWRAGPLLVLLGLLAGAAQADSEIGGAMPEALKGVNPSGYSCQRDDVQRNAKGTTAPGPSHERPAPALACAIEPSQFLQLSQSSSSAQSAQSAQASSSSPSSRPSPTGGQNKRPVLMVDTRSAPAFEAAHVDGALNASAVQLRTKPYLRDRTLVLMGTGKAEQELYVACAELKAQGFPDVRVMRGGMARWAGQGHPVVGRSAGGPGTAGQAGAMGEGPVTRLTPTELWLEQQFGANLVLVAPSHTALLQQLPYAMPLQTVSTSAIQAVLERRRKEMKNAPLAAVVVVADVPGETLQAVSKALPAVPLMAYTETVDTYLREMRQQQLSWNAQAHGPKQPPCRR